MLARLDPKLLRKCLGHFATGVTVVTCRGEEATHGVTVNAFTSVSFEPPLVLVSLDRRATACGLLEGSGFTVNLLGEDQADLAWHFAGKPKEDPSDIPWEEGERAPRLGGCIAWIECSPWRSYDGGDHVLHLGEVEDFEFRSGEPLLFYAGKLRTSGPAIDEVPWLEFLDCLPNEGWLANSLQPRKVEDAVDERERRPDSLR